MVVISGIYQNGYLKLEKEVSSDKPMKVIVTFLEEMEPPAEKRLLLADFSFFESQELLKNFDGSLSDSVIEERRSDV